MSGERYKCESKTRPKILKFCPFLPFYRPFIKANPEILSMDIGVVNIMDAFILDIGE